MTHNACQSLCRVCLLLYIFVPFWFIFSYAASPTNVSCDIRILQSFGQYTMSNVNIKHLTIFSQCIVNCINIPLCIRFYAHFLSKDSTFISMLYIWSISSFKSWSIFIITITILCRNRTSKKDRQYNNQTIVTQRGKQTWL